MLLLSITRRPSHSLHLTSHFHSTPKPHQDLSTFFTHLLQSHPHPRSTHQIHAQILTQGSSSNSFTATHLLKSYAKTQDLHSARFVFESVPNKRIFLWNALVRACSIHEFWGEVVDLYKRMEEERVEPDHYTLPFVIKAFGVLYCVEQGKRVHNLVCGNGLLRNVYVATSLMEMYIEFGEIELARKLFDEMPREQRDVVAWTSMISGYVNSGNSKEAVRLFSDMRLGDLKPNWVTLLALVPACDYSVHSIIVKSGFDLFAEVEIAVLNMYAKAADIGMAESLFNGMSEKNLVSWTVMVSGYSQNGYADEALLMFYQMITMTEHKPDSVIIASALQACAHLGSLSCGEMIHGYFIQIGPISELQVETSLVDMYAKCGSLKDAEKVFNRIQDPNVVAWSALIAGYGYHGYGYNALDVFEKMKKEGFVPDEAAFLGILSACSHSGLVSKGKEVFDSMQRTYMVIPRTKHYACMIDLLGRAGLVDEAVDLIKGMLVEPDRNVWGALLSACKIKGNVEIAEYACRRLLELDPNNVDYHVLIANIYAGCGRWDEVSNLRSVIRRKGEKKTPGCSYIEVNCKVHEFFAGDRTHLEFNNIHFVLDLLHTLASDEHLNTG